VRTNGCSLRAHPDSIRALTATRVFAVHIHFRVGPAGAVLTRSACQCRFKFPQMCRSIIPQLGGFSRMTSAKVATPTPSRLLKRSLARRRLGPDHPVVALNLNNLAALYLDEGRYAAPSRSSSDRLRFERTHAVPINNLPSQQGLAA
jgi:hypothetical protein